MNDKEWAERWLEQVADGSLRMSQRKLTTVEKNGGLYALQEVAVQKQLHLLLLTDDTGTELVAASKDPFTTIC